MNTLIKAFSLAYWLFLFVLVVRGKNFSHVTLYSSKALRDTPKPLKAEMDFKEFYSLVVSFFGQSF